MKKRRTYYKGYTLIELLVVMLISGILLSMGAVEYGTATSESKIQSFHSSVLTALSGAESYRQKYGEYPDTDTFNALLRDQRYFSIPPKNPYTGKTLQATTDTSSEAKNTLGYFYYSLTPDGNIKVETNPPLDIDVAQMEEPEKGTTSTYAVSFTVVDGNGSPISGAQIMINGKTLTTDAQGKATTALAAGTYFYSATKTGYNFVNGSLSVSGNTSKTISMSSSSFTVTVIVKNESGDPITGAYVTGIGNDGKTTDAEGKATFTGISAGTYNIVATATGYEQTSAAVTVKSNQQVKLTMPKLRFYTVNIFVTDTDGNPIEGAVIKGIGSGGVTGSDGKATIANVLAGAYTITVEAVNYNQQQKNITVNSNQDITFALTLSTYTVTISVVDADNGTPVSGAIVSGIGSDSKTTDSSGKATFANVLSGAYAVNISAPNYVSVSQSINVSKNANAFSIALTKLKGSLTVTVKDSSSGAVISGANVTLSGIGSQTTNSSGQVTFSNVPYGTYTLSVSAGDYGNVSQSVTINSSSQSLTVSLSKLKGSVTVTVKDSSSGAVISGANVTLSGIGSQTTNSSGQVTFSNVTYGSYTISVSKTGYNDYSTSITVNNSTNTVNVALVQSKYTVVVQVTDAETGGAIAGASVGGIGSGGVTGSDGKVTFSNVTYGTYTINVSASNYASNSKTVTIDSNQTVSIALTKLKGSLTVTVKDSSSGVVITGANVTLSGIGSQTTNSSGQVTFSNVPYGTYTLSVSAGDYGNVSQSVTINSSSQSLTVSLSKLKGSVTVTVKDSSSGAVISGANVTLSGIGSQTTNSSGQVTFSNVTYGSYTISVSKTGYNDYSTSITVNNSTNTVNVALVQSKYTVVVQVTDAETGGAIAGASVGGIGSGGVTGSDGKVTFSNVTYGTYTINVSASNYASNSKTVTIDSNQTVSIALTKLKGSLTVTVKDSSSGVVITGANVTLSGIGSQTTNSSGQVTFSNVPYGTYTLSVSAGDYGNVSQSVTINSSSQSLTVSLSKLKGSVTVTVKDSSSGAVISGANVTLSGIGSQTTNSSGQVTFSNVTYGSYTISVSKTGYNDYSTSITVNNSTNTVNVALVQSKYTVVVQVTDAETGGAIAGASVGGIGSGGVTGSDGKVTFSNVTYGTYTINVSASNYASNSKTVTIDSNQTVSIALTKLKGSLTVTVKDSSSGVVITGANVTLSGIGSQTTNSSGQVTFSNVPYGTYTLSVYKNLNYSQVSMSVEVTQSNINVNIPLQRLITEFVLNFEAGFHYFGVPVRIEKTIADIFPGLDVYRRDGDSWVLANNEQPMPFAAYRVNVTTPTTIVLQGERYSEVSIAILASKSTYFTLPDVDAVGIQELFGAAAKSVRVINIGGVASDVPLTGQIEPGKVYLVQLNRNATVTINAEENTMNISKLQSKGEAVAKNKTMNLTILGGQTEENPMPLAPFDDKGLGLGRNKEMGMSAVGSYANKQYRYFDNQLLKTVGRHKTQTI